MKKLKYLCIIVLAVLFITNGCAKTPDTNVVVGKKNLEQTIKDKEIPSNNNSVDGATSANYNWPLSYTDKLDGPSNFSINADVITSGAKYYPVKKARAAAYPASKIETIINKFANGTKLYRNEDVMNTKETIQEEILIQKRLIHDVQSGKNKEYAGSIENLNTYLKELETKYNSASSQASLNPVNDYLKLLNVNGELQLASLDVVKKTFIVTNNNPRFVRFYINPCEDNTALRNKDSINTISLSRADAEKQAKEIVDSLGYADMSLSATSAGVYLANFTENNKNNKNSVYYFYFTRSVDGTPMNYEETDIASYPPSDGQKAIYSEPWPYEFISIALDKNGVQEIFINGNLEIVDTVSKNVKLLDFNDMIEKAKSAIKQKYGSYNDTEQTKEKHRYNIDTIKLGYMQVVSKDNPDEFMIIPVWDFFGTEYINDEELPRRHHSYLTINALDGSIIDRALGY